MTELDQRPMYMLTGEEAGDAFDAWARTKPRFREVLSAGPEYVFLQKYQTMPEYGDRSIHVFFDWCYDCACWHIDEKRRKRAATIRAVFLIIVGIVGNLIIPVVPLILCIVGSDIIIKIRDEPSPEAVEYHRAQYAANRAIEERYGG